MYKQLIYFLLFTFFFTLLLAPGCGKKEVEEEPIVRPVKTMVLGKGLAGTRMTYPGRTEAKETADLSFQAAGKVIELPVDRGQEVKQGDLIAKIETEDFASDVRAKEAEAARAKAELERYSKLYEDDAVPLRDVEVRERDYKVALSDLEIARKALSDTTLTAPFHGVISRKFVENFQFVKAREPIVRVQDLSNIDIVVDVPESDVVGAPSADTKVDAVATFDALPDREFDIKLKEWETQADEATQTFSVKFTMPTPEDARVMPGMTANVAISFKLPPGEVGKQVFVVPSTAVFADEVGVSNVWVVNQETMTVSKRPVELGQITGSAGVQVTSGLEPGDMIVATAARHLREGMKIKSLEPTKGAA